MIINSPTNHRITERVEYYLTYGHVYQWYNIRMRHNSIVQVNPIIVHQILLITIVNHIRMYLYLFCL